MLFCKLDNDDKPLMSFQDETRIKLQLNHHKYFQRLMLLNLGFIIDQATHSQKMKVLAK